MRPRHAVRHRAGRPAARADQGRARRDGRAAARPGPGQGALRRRLVHPAAAASRGCATPRWTSRCWSSCATLLDAELAQQGKLDWARQEFAALAAAPPPAPRTDPWRRTSGMHRVRDRRQLAGGPRAVAGPGPARPRARHRAGPGPAGQRDRRGRDRAARRPSRRCSRCRCSPAAARAAAPRRWQAAIDTARQLPDADAAAAAPCPRDGPPPARAWADRDPAAAARLAAARAALAARAGELDIPVENLLSPDPCAGWPGRRPAPADEAAVAALLRRHGARAWQVELLPRRSLAAARLSRHRRPR